MVAIPNAYAYRMPAGIPGGVTREYAHDGEPNQLDLVIPPAAFGDFCKMGPNSRVQALVAGDAPTAIYGVLERAFPGQPGTSYGPATQALGAVTAPAPGGRCTVLKKGYAMVVVQGSAVPSKGGPVFVRLANPPAGGRVGGVEAAADSTSGNTIQVPHAYFMGAPDTAGNTEMAYAIGA